MSSTSKKKTLGSTEEDNMTPRVGLYKTFVHFKADVHELTILFSPPPTCIAHPGAILLDAYRTVYESPPDLPFVCYTPYNIGDTNIV